MVRALRALTGLNWPWPALPRTPTHLLSTGQELHISSVQDQQSWPGLSQVCLFSALCLVWFPGWTSELCCRFFVPGTITRWTSDYTVPCLQPVSGPTSFWPQLGSWKDAGPGAARHCQWTLLPVPVSDLNVQFLQDCGSSVRAQTMWGHPHLPTCPAHGVVSPCCTMTLNVEWNLSLLNVIPDPSFNLIKC